MCPATDDQIEILKLTSLINAKDEIIVKQTAELNVLRKKIEKVRPKKKSPQSKIAVKPAAKKAAAVKASDKAGTSTRSLAQIAAEALAKAKVPVKKTAKKPAASKILQKNHKTCYCQRKPGNVCLKIKKMEGCS